MADAYKTLYQGQLPASVATLATVGVGKSWIAKHFSAVNVSAAAVTFRLYRNGTTDAFAWTPTAIIIPPGGMVEWDGTESMAAGETLAGVASASSSVTLTLSGDEVT